MGLFSWVTGIFSESASGIRTRDADILFDDLTSPFMSHSPHADSDISTDVFLNNDMMHSSMENTSIADLPTINPANGLPMIDGISGLDIAGNLWGTDCSNSSLFDQGAMTDHDLNYHDTFAGFDDGFNSSHDTFSNGSGFDNW